MAMVFAMPSLSMPVVMITSMLNLVVMWSLIQSHHPVAAKSTLDLGHQSDLEAFCFWLWRIADSSVGSFDRRP